MFDDSCYPQWGGSGGSRYAYVAGTSFAAPEVAGVAALIWAARPELKNYEVADIIKRSARRDAATGWTPTMGCGRLDAAAALDLATGRSSGDTACSVAGDGPPVWPDVTTPTAVALEASGSRGTTLNLQYWVGDLRVEVAAEITVQRGNTTIAHLTQGFFGVQPGHVYALAWSAPRVKKTGPFRFCVVLSNRAGDKSAPSCAPIRLR